MGDGKAEQKNMLTAPTLEQGNSKPAQEGWQGREGAFTIRNSQASWGMSHLIPPPAPLRISHRAAGDALGLLGSWDSAVHCKSTQVWRQRACPLVNTWWIGVTGTQSTWVYLEYNHYISSPVSP